MVWRLVTKDKDKGAPQAEVGAWWLAIKDKEAEEDDGVIPPIDFNAADDYMIEQWIKDAEEAERRPKKSKAAPLLTLPGELFVAKRNGRSCKTSCYVGPRTSFVKASSRENCVRTLFSKIS